MVVSVIWPRESRPFLPSHGARWLDGDNAAIAIVAPNQRAEIGTMF